MASLVSSAVLMVLLLAAGAVALGEQRLRHPTVPWLAVALLALAVTGLVLQHVWPGATAALDADPARSGWWRHGTAVFLQNGGVAGVVFNLVTLVVAAALAEWFWGTTTATLLAVAGVAVPVVVGGLVGIGPGADPRDFVGSSGLTFALAATLAGALAARAPRAADRTLGLVAAGVGLAAWWLLGNAHGLVTVYGAVLGAVGAVLVGSRLDVAPAQPPAEKANGPATRR